MEIPAVLKATHFLANRLFVFVVVTYTVYSKGRIFHLLCSTLFIALPNGAILNLSYIKVG